jgi:cytochrome c oxidase cbb3-type subunit 2
MSFHHKLERNSILMLVCILVVVVIGGIVELTPLFTIESTVPKVKGMRPYTPLELAGRNIYIREGCYVCHSQMIRAFRDEVERYGPYSLASESMYDHPFQWGSKRTGPDLARVGGKYSNEWHVAHFISPRELVPESIMPPYSHFAERTLNYDDMALHLKTNQQVGVPYSEEMIAYAISDLEAQVNPDGDIEGLLARYPKAVVANFDGDAARITEMDAVIAYLQMLGTLVEFGDMPSGQTGGED